MAISYMTAGGGAVPVQKLKNAGMFIHRERAWCVFGAFSLRSGDQFLRHNYQVP